MSVEEACFFERFIGHVRHVEAAQTFCAPYEVRDLHPVVLDLRHDHGVIRSLSASRDCELPVVLASLPTTTGQYSLEMSTKAAPLFKPTIAISRT